jgi:transposase
VARRPDPKVAELARSRTLNPHPETVADELFGASSFFDARDLVQVKYEMVRKVERKEASVAGAAAAFGLSRQTYYTAAQALAAGGLPGLLPDKPGPRRAHKLTDEVLDYVTSLLVTGGARSSADLARVIEERFGLHVHRRSVERALARREADGRPKSG